MNIHIKLDGSPTATFTATILYGVVAMFVYFIQSEDLLHAFREYPRVAVVIFFVLCSALVLLAVIHLTGLWARIDAWIARKWDEFCGELAATMRGIPQEQPETRSPDGLLTKRRF